MAKFLLQNICTYIIFIGKYEKIFLLTKPCVCVCVCVRAYVRVRVCMRARVCGPGSSVDIVTGYGLDGPGSNPGGDEIFRPSRPALEPNQPPVKWVPGLSRR